MIDERKIADLSPADLVKIIHQDVTERMELLGRIAGMKIKEKPSGG